MAAIFQDGGFSPDGKVWENSGYVEEDVRNTLQKVSFRYYFFPGLSLITLHYTELAGNRKNANMILNGKYKIDFI